MSSILDALIALFEVPASLVELLSEDVAPPVLWWACGVLAWRLRGVFEGVVSVLGFAAVDAIGLWRPAAATLAFVAIGAAVGWGVGLPLGAIARRPARSARPVAILIDLVHAAPAFAFVLAAAVLFGLRVEAAVAATIAFSIVATSYAQVHRAPPSGTATVTSPWFHPVARATLRAAIAIALLADLVGGRGLGSEVIRTLPIYQRGLDALSREDAVLAAQVLFSLLVVGWFCDVIAAPRPRSKEAALMAASQEEAGGRATARSDAPARDGARGRVAEPAGGVDAP